MKKLLSLLKAIGTVTLVKRSGNFLVRDLKSYTQQQLDELKQVAIANNCTISLMDEKEEIDAIATAKTGTVTYKLRYDKAIICKPSQQEDDDSLLAGFGKV